MDSIFRHGPLSEVTDTALDARFRIRDAYRNFIFRLNASHFITFNFGCQIRPDSASVLMDVFCCKLERRAHGRNWNKYPANKRITLVGFPEHLDSNRHWHAVAGMPNETGRVLNRLGSEIWANLVARGQLHQEAITSRQAVETYITKHLHRSRAIENVYVFTPLRKTGA